MKTQVIIIVLVVIFIVLSISGCTRPTFEDMALDVPQITVSSASIDETGELLIETAADKAPNNPLGSNESPQLTWDAVDGAMYYAVCMFDEDANWLHLLVLDLEKTELEQGKYTSRADYVGPYPPQIRGCTIIELRCLR